MTILFKIKMNIIIKMMSCFNKCLLSKYLLSVVTSLFILTSCNEDPTQMGLTLLNDTVSVHSIGSSDAVLITEINSYRYYINTISRSVIHIGKYKNVTAFSLLRFDEIIKQVDSLDFLADFTEEDIISCELSMPVKRYTLGDSINPNALSFKVFKVIDYWSNLSTADTIQEGSIIEDSKIIAEFNGAIEQRDTMNAISMSFDKSLIVEWFKEWLKYKQEDSTAVVWGVAFVPDENSTVIRQFRGTNDGVVANVQPELTIHFMNKNDVLDSIVLKSTLDKSFYDIPETDDDFMTVQGGVSTRGKMYFDISMIPNNSAIHAAQLELFIDTTKSIYGNNGLDSLLYGKWQKDTSDIYSTLYWDTYPAERIGNKFFFKRITSAFDMWNRTDGKGFLTFSALGTQNEEFELDKIVFYGINAPDSLKPRLKIIYSTRPDSNK